LWKFNNSIAILCLYGHFIEDLLYYLGGNYELDIDSMGAQER